MEYILIILLVVSIMLVLISSWCLNTYLLLHKTMSNYDTDKQFAGACGMNKQYVSIGIIISAVFLGLGGIAMITSSIMIYRS